MNASSASAPSGANRPAPRGRMRQAQREFTRGRIIDAAIEVFASDGFARSTIDDIAASAGVTRATYYLHFASKADVLSAFAERAGRHFDQMYRNLGSLALTPTFDSVRVWIDAAMSEWPSIADLARPLFEAAAFEPDVHALVYSRDADHAEGLARTLVDAGVVEETEDAEIYATVLLAPLNHYFRLFLRGVPFERERVLDILAGAWVAVISVPEKARS